MKKIFFLIFIIQIFINSVNSTQFFNFDFTGKTAAVLIYDEGGSERFIGSSENEIMKAFQNAGIKMIDREQLEKLKKDDYTKAAIINSNAAAFLKIKEKYKTDILICGYLNAESSYAIGNYWSGVSFIALKFLNTSDASLLGIISSDRMGVIGNPAIITQTEFSAKQGAILKSIGDVLNKIEIPYLNSPVEIQPVIFPKLFLKKNDFEYCMIKFSPTNKNIAVAASKDGRILILNISDNKIGVKEIDNVRYEIKSLNFSTDGKYLIFTDDLQNLHIYDFQNQKKICDFKSPHKKNILSVIAGKKKIYSASKDNEIYLYDFSGNIANSLEDKILKNGLLDLSLSPEENFLISVSLNRAIIWSVNNETGDLVFYKKINIFENENSWKNSDLTSCAISHDGQIFAAGILETDIDIQRNIRKDKGKIIVIDNYSGQVIAVLTNLNEYSRKNKCITDLSFVGNRRFLLSGGKNETFIVWDIEKSRELSTVDIGKKVLKVNLNNQGCFAGIITEDNELLIFSL
ncbi:MAG TPA: hypothetical protein PLQ81_06100 [bacterium]|nr:hypothetical protein [bacterium]